MTLSLRERFESKYLPHPATGCWNWLGAKTTAGYGSFGDQGERLYAHRLSYLIYKGAIPPGLDIDHLCRNRACVNPYHLEVVTRRENALRGELRLRRECPHGHPYDLLNTYWYNGHRQCLACRNRRNKERYQ